jgi:hypothetical protein
VSHLVAAIEGLTFLMVLRLVLRLQRFPLSRCKHRYYGSAVTLNEEAVKATFSSPNRIVAPFHLGLIDATYRTRGRRRVSSVTTQVHFLQAAACVTVVICVWHSARPFAGRVGDSRASSRGGDWRITLAENAVSRSLSAWSLRHVIFSGGPGNDTLTAYLRVVCGVRAESSVRARTRTGRL